jgi:SNF family Na+-dependent transporter
MDVKTTFIIAMAIVIVTMYYLEREMKKEQIFWLYSGLGVLFGLASVYTVAKDIPSYDYYITFAVLFILIAIIYFDQEESAVESKEKPVKKAQKKKAKKRKKK